MTIEELQNKLLNTNVNKHVEEKNNCSYLTWAWAWAEALKADPNANYEIITFDGVPYKETPLGIMCYTKVTIGGVTRSMWLPVLNNRQDAMFAEDKKNDKGFIISKAADMFDINKTIMRCLTKNLAMFGLGLYLYAGEDLPEDVEAKQEKKDDKPIKEDQGFTLKQASATVTDMRDHVAEVKAKIDQLPLDKVEAWADWFERKFHHHWKQATPSEADYFIAAIDKFLTANKEGA